MGEDPPEGQLVRGRSEARYHRQGLVREEAMVTERLASKNIAEVHLDEGQTHREEGVPNADRTVGEAGSIDQDPLEIMARSLDPVNQHSLMVRLIGDQLSAQGVGQLSKVGVDLGEGLVAVEAGLAGTEQVEVGSVEDADAQGVQARSKTR